VGVSNAGINVADGRRVAVSLGVGDGLGVTVSVGIDVGVSDGVNDGVGNSDRLAANAAA
jgi:hypothetical protein